MSSDRPLNENIVPEQVRQMLDRAIALLQSGKRVEALQMAEKATALGVTLPGIHYVRAMCLFAVGQLQKSLEAAQAELLLDPTHPQARAHVAKLTRSLSKPVPYKVPTGERSWNTSLPREPLLSIQQGSLNYSYRGVSMFKNPFDLALYSLLIWNLKPRTIIEIGSYQGGSALWFGDQLNNFDIDGHVYSLDVVKVTSLAHPRVTFMEGNGRSLQETLTPAFLNVVQKPLLVVEDSDHMYATSHHVLEFFHPYLAEGDYILIEDGIISDLDQDTSYSSGPHKALKEFLSAREGEYEIDGDYCDLFGYNVTWCTNGWLKKIKCSKSN